MGFFVNQYTSSQVSDIVIKDILETNNFSLGVGYVSDPKQDKDEKAVVATNSYIAKYDLDGALLWQKKYSITGSTTEGFFKIVQLTNGEFVVLGKDQNQVWLVWINEEGNIIRNKKYYNLPTASTGSISFESDYIIQLLNNELVLLVKEFVYSTTSVLTAINNVLIKVNGTNGNLVSTRKIWKSTADEKYVNIYGYSVVDNSIVFISNSSSLGGTSLVITINSALSVSNRYKYSYKVSKTERFTFFAISQPSISHLFLLGGITDQAYGQTGKYVILKLDRSIKNIVSSRQLNLSFSNTDTQNDRKEIFYADDGIYLRTSNLVSRLSDDLNLLWSKSVVENSLDLFLPHNKSIPCSFILKKDALQALGRIDKLFDCCITANSPSFLVSTITITKTTVSDVASASLTNTNYSALTLNVIVLTNSVVTEICPFKPEFFDETTSLQSPNFYLQAAGSSGDDSTLGIHTRWIFKGALGNKHLPKGNLASSNVNFNKPEDFVKLYRASYTKNQVTIDFTVAPTLVDNTNKVWIYKMNNGERVFYIYFRNPAKYNQVLQTHNPLTASFNFIKQYGAELIEVENKKEMFFAGKIEIESASLPLVNSKLELEGLQVEENSLISPKILSFRKSFASSGLSNMEWTMENGRSIRFKATTVTVKKIHFEFYSDFINAATWKYLGKYALSLIDNQVYQMLEPSGAVVNGKWLRYNDGAKVNVNNYKDKWSRNAKFPDKNLKQVVSSYISLSDNSNNPIANEDFSLIHEDGYPQPGDSPDDIMTISNLDMLRIASYDYHIARMLGLGTLDIENTVTTGKYVYLAEYRTFADLEDGLGAREVHHLSMSLPTATSDHRLPLPVKLKNIVPGAFIGLDSPEPSSITDENGYTFDGKLRYVTLYSEYFPDDQFNPPFFQTTEEFDKSTSTYPVYAGLEYKKKLIGGTLPPKWEKPEISHDTSYLNVDSDPNSFETVPVLVPEVPRPLYVHTHNISGIHYYDTYGINWFSRAARANHILEIETVLKPKNLLSPPYEINPLLIVPEAPLMFTSQEEQIRLNAITENDKTLIRVPFCYDSANELYSYKVPNEVIDPLLPGTIFPDDEEIYAKEIDIFFRNSVPLGVSGKAIEVTDHSINPLLSIITTGQYIYLSNGNEVTPHIPLNLKQNFIGGAFVMGSQSYIIQDIAFPDNSGDNPIFTVYKKEVSDGIILDTIPTVDSEELISPEIIGDGLFNTAENMQNEYCWNKELPLPFKVKIGDNRTDFSIHRELLLKTNDDGLEERFIEKTRGFWSTAKIEEKKEVIRINQVIDENGNTVNVPECDFNGLYKITFDEFILSQHSQFSQNANSVEWWNGVIHLFTENSFNGSGNPIKSRKLFKVVSVENIGTDQNLIIYFEDPVYNILDPHFLEKVLPTYDKIKTGNHILVNYYPGYKVYLYKNDPYKMTRTETGILPAEGQGMKYSVFGLRSVDTVHFWDSNPYKSRISVPALMYAQEVIPALTPEKPKGPLYATRPDYFGRSTYTFTTKYDHKPFGVLMGRSNDEVLLNALYEPETVIRIRQNLELLGGQNEEYFTNRWENFFDYNELKVSGNYKTYPPEGTENYDQTYRLPLPNKKKLFEEINNFIVYHNDKFGSNISEIQEANFGTILLNQIIINNLFNEQGSKYQLIDFVQNAIYYSFVPLTEMPVVYQHIPEMSHQPIDEKQVVKDENGYVIPPDDPRFKMAPMMKINSVTPNHSTLYTDFHLDGYSNNFYFYGVREVSSQMRLGEFSQFLGPIKLVNSNAPEAPEVKRIMPVLENQVLGILPHIQIEINRYPDIQNIRKINIYRTFDRLQAQSVRSMDLVKVVDIEDEEMLQDDIWVIHDFFEDLPEIQYGDGIYYRITVSRKIEYAKADYAYGTENSSPEIIVEYAPSRASKIVATLMVDTKTPEAPILSYFYSQENQNGELEEVTIKWEKTVYNGKYHLYKMNSQGNWLKITENPIQTNEQNIEVLLSNTLLQYGSLQIKDENGNPIYHHFKVVVENTSGNFSKEEKILTIPNVGFQNDLDGIGYMDIEGTFQVS